MAVKEMMRGEIEPVRRSISIGDGAMSLIEWAPRGADTVLFVHANGFNAQTYRTLLSPLSARLHVIACDLRGHGYTKLPAQPGLARDWSIFGKDLLALMRAISKDPIILAGHSLGATTSFMAAAGRPERVKSLVLIEPVFLAPLPPGVRGNSNSLAESAAQRRSTFVSHTTAMAYYRKRGIFARWPEAILRDYLNGGLVENADGALRLACTPEWEAEIFREVPFGIAVLAEKVKCPITILRGTVGTTAIDNQITAILQARPNSRVITIEAANHFLPLEQPEHVREEILRAANLL
ncbi:MAG TPA: alpha/beta hydrolase [Rhizomicrobium sp.]|jgi:pimeloyl-ACP methyl ester carboxylesterase|nr:alpha/beta hydrolase [Rhizomicrobium sp.]